MEAFKDAVRARARAGTTADGVPVYRCERCRRLTQNIDAHHIVARPLCKKAWKHNPDINGAALCRVCHRLVEDGIAEDSRDWVGRAALRLPVPLKGTTGWDVIASDTDGGAA